jgi:hypothetical protein
MAVSAPLREVCPFPRLPASVWQSLHAVRKSAKGFMIKDDDASALGSCPAAATGNTGSAPATAAAVAARAASRARRIERTEPAARLALSLKISLAQGSRRPCSLQPRNRMIFYILRRFGFRCISTRGVHRHFTGTSQTLHRPRQKGLLKSTIIKDQPKFTRFMHETRVHQLYTCSSSRCVCRTWNYN